MLRGVRVMPTFIGSLPQNCWETAPAGAWQAAFVQQHVFFKTTPNVWLLLWSLV